MISCEAPLREVSSASAARRLRSRSGGTRAAAADGWRPEPAAGWAAMRAKECSAVKRRCEKWRRRRQLGGCDREAAVHGPLQLMAGGQSHRQDGRRCEPRIARLRSTAGEVAAVASASAARRLRSRSGGPWAAAADGWRPEPPTRQAASRAKDCSAAKHRCEKCRRRRQLGGGDLGAVAHELMLLRAGDQGHRQDGRRCEPRSARLQSTAARSGGGCGGGSSEAAVEKWWHTSCCG